jgi:hypothetical protein
MFIDGKKFAAALAMVLLTAVLSLPEANAGPSFEASSAGRKTGLVVASIGTSILYTPAKALYAGGSVITSGLVLGFTLGESDEEAGRISRRGLRGDWWVHPDVFTGHRSLHFVGEP